MTAINIWTTDIRRVDVRGLVTNCHGRIVIETIQQYHHVNPSWPKPSSNDKNNVIGAVVVVGRACGNSGRLTVFIVLCDQDTCGSIGELTGALQISYLLKETVV
jgi:hypothetical protein